MPEYSNYVESRDPVVGALSGDELLAVSKDGDAVRITTQQIANIAGDPITREFDRAFSAEILFDKNEIGYALHELTGDLAYTVAPAGNITDQFSSAIQRVETDGTRMVTFEGFTHVLGDIQSGNIPDAGTYPVMFIYYNGIAIANWGKPSQEVSNLIILTTPANMVAAQDGETAIDVSWDNVTNNSGYQIYFSLTGGTGGWTSLAVLAADTVTYKHTGLSAGDQRFYRVRALGDLVTYQNSNFAYADTTITEAADVTAPTFVFLPANGNNTWSVNEPLTITADEPMQNTNGTEITNANVAALITLKETNAAGANIGFTATIDATKKIIRIFPTTIYGVTQLVYLAINNVEDVNGNEVTVAQSITFTTTEYTWFDGTSNMLIQGDVLDATFGAADTNFEIEITLQNPSLIGGHRIFAKAGEPWLGTGKTFSFHSSATDLAFAYYHTTGSLRFVQWAGALSTPEHKYVIKYDGSIDTNDGLDRVVLEIDDIVQGSKTLIQSSGALTSTLANTANPLAVGNLVNSANDPVTSQYYSGVAKGFKVRGTNGTVTLLDVPVLATGDDVSANNLDGSWV